nr:hypothetical protein AMTR_s02100p00009220 [Ipomoea trifida]
MRLLGVILEETSQEELQKQATVKPSVLKVLLEITKCCDLYLMERVLDDESEDPLRVIDGPLTRARAKQLQDTVGGLISARWDAAKKAKWVKDIHAQVSQHIARRNEQVARQVNKGRRKVVFNPGDWVWLHLRKSQFPVQRRSKLMPRGDGPFQVASRINDNAHKLALPREYGVSTSFNVSDLFPFNEDEADSGTNPSMEGGDVEDSKDPL